jgi:hypothetical protein
MADCAPCTPPENECYPIENPCTSYAKVYNAIIARAVQGGVTGYRVGEESFQFAHISMADLRSMADNLYGLCVACGGCPPPLTAKRKRANICFVYSGHQCRICGAARCGCAR